LRRFVRALVRVWASVPAGIVNVVAFLPAAQRATRGLIVIAIVKLASRVENVFARKRNLLTVLVEESEHGVHPHLVARRILAAAS
jgi:hypothetical protein